MMGVVRQIMEVKLAQGARRVGDLEELLGEQWTVSAAPGVALSAAASLG